MLNSPLLGLRNINALVFRRSSIITASDTLASGMSTLVSATIAGAGGMGSSSSGRSEDGVGRAFRDRCSVALAATLAEPAHVALELPLDLVGGTVEGDVRIGPVGRFEHHP